METKQIYWLREVLLNFQSEEEARQHAAWNHLCKMTGKSMSVAIPRSAAIALVYQVYSRAEEQEQFLKEIKQLIQFSKKLKLTLQTMETIISVVAAIGKLDEFAYIFARTFVFAWHNAHERKTLVSLFLLECEDAGESEEICNAVSYLRENKWIPRQYAVDTCCVLLGARPDRWFNTMARMLPVMSRYKNKLVREGGVAGRKTWAIAEGRLKSKMRKLGLF